MLADGLSAAVPIIARHPMKTLHEQKIRIDRWLGRYRLYRLYKLYRRIKEGLVLWRTIKKAPVILEDLDVLVVSCGGAGTGTLLTFLEKHHMGNHTVANKKTDKIKLGHGARLFPDLDRCSRIIYLFGAPVSAVVSFFRRGFPFEQYLILQANFRWFPSFLLTEKLRKYAKEGKNKFPFEQHFDFWFNARLRQPILFIRYETLWDNLDVVFDFLDLPADMRSDFPKYRRRESDVDALPPDVKAGLDRMYGEFSKKLESLPDHILHMPPHTRSSGNAP